MENRPTKSKVCVMEQGLCHMLRKEVWKFLLGYFPWDSTLEERKAVTRDKTYASSFLYNLDLL